MDGVAYCSRSSAGRLARDENRHQEDAESEPGPQIRVPKGVLGWYGPELEACAGGVEERKEREPEESGRGQPRLAGHSFLSHRSRTNFQTASARFLGMSRGLSIFSVRPVAR